VIQDSVIDHRAFPFTLVRWALSPDPQRAGFHNEPRSIDPPCALSIVKSEKLAKTLEIYPSGRFCINISIFHNVFFFPGGKQGQRGVLTIRMGENLGIQIQIKKEHQGGRNHPGGTKEGYEDSAGYAARRLPPGVVSGSALKMLIGRVAWNFS
jgi:hypothetical protein